MRLSQALQVSCCCQQLFAISSPLVARLEPLLGIFNFSLHLPQERSDGKRHLVSFNNLGLNMKHLTKFQYILN
jgi:hypothetical protein